MESFVRGFDVRLISCLSTHPRLTAWQRRNEVVPTERAALRLFIDTEDTPALFDTNNWQESIAISDWHFNGKDNLQSLPTTAIYNTGSHNRNSTDNVSIAVEHPAMV